MPQLGQPYALIEICNPMARAGNPMFQQTLKCSSLFTTAISRFMRVVSVKFIEDSIYYTVHGTVEDVETVLEALKKKVHQQMETIFGSRDRLLYKELKKELRNLDSKYQSNINHTRLEKFMDVYMALFRLCSKKLSDNAIALARRLLNGDIELYAQLKDVDSFIYSIRHGPVNSTNPDPSYVCAESMLGDAFQECLKGQGQGL